jgi:hypothetical protein
MDPTPEEIIIAYRAELERVHGKKFARAAIVEYRGSATSCRMRFAILSWTINGCETTSAGR